MRMNQFVKVILSSVFLFFQGHAMASDLINELKQVRENNRSAEIDISSNLKKYLPEGMEKQKSTDFLEKEGFSLTKVATKDQVDTVIASYVEKNLRNKLGFHDEIKVVMTFQNNVIKQINGKLIYRAL